MARYVVPTGASTQPMLEMLFDGKVQIGKGAALKPEASHVGAYTDETGAVVAVCAADLPFAVFAGAAMSAIPLPAAKDAIGAKQPTETMLANLGEVMNILSRLLMSDSSPHLRFKEVWKPGEHAAELKALAAPARVDISVAVPRYGTGNLSFLVT